MHIHNHLSLKMIAVWCNSGIFILLHIGGNFKSLIQSKANVLQGGVALFVFINPVSPFMILVHYIGIPESTDNIWRWFQGME